MLEMDGQFDKLEELIYVESHLSNTSAKFYGEITQQMLKNSSFPGSTNGTGLFQTIVGLKVRCRGEGRGPGGVCAWVLGRNAAANMAGAGGTQAATRLFVPVGCRLGGGSTLPKAHLLP